MIETEQEGNETPEYPTMPEQEEPSPEIEGFPLWKRNNQPSRLFYPANPQIGAATGRGKYMRMRQNNQNQKESSRVL